MIKEAHCLKNKQLKLFSGENNLAIFQKSKEGEQVWCCQKSGTRPEQSSGRHGWGTKQVLGGILEQGENFKFYSGCEINCRKI